MSRVIVFTTTVDEPYWSMTLVALHTLYVHDGHWPIHLHLINGTDAHEDQARFINPDVSAVEHQRPFKQTPFTVTFSRPRVMMDLLDSGIDQILSLDGDVIVRGPLEGIWDDVEPSTLKIWFKGNQRKERTRFQGAVYLFGNSSETRAMYRDFIDRLGHPKGWYDGQEGLYTTWRRHKNHVRHVQLDVKYNDNLMSPHSLIWHVKHGHYDEQPWKKEWSKWKVEVDARLSAVQTK